jgi:hypothetical protein
MFGRITPIALVLPGIIVPGALLPMSGGSLAMLGVLIVLGFGLRGVL